MKNVTYIYLVLLLIFSCSPKIIQKSESVNEATLIKSKNTGYFHAIGREPFWNLEIAENSIRFKEVNAENEINISHVEPVKVMDANIKMYISNSEEQEMKIIIEQKDCTDKMSDNKYFYQVKVELKKKNQTAITTFYGCGYYIADYRLYDNWVLEELKGKKVSKDNFANEVPLLEINASDKKIIGYAGCNRINGTLFQERELLRFTNIISTRMACDEANLEQEYLKCLQSSTRYEIKNNRLYLSTPSELLIVFKKID
jgi:heat shock protein HslJ/uncharacterized membrane protein